MAQTFTDKEFDGIEFNCYSKDASCGWYHVCEAVKDGEVIMTNKVHYINRTWERYCYETVYEGCKSLLRNINEKKKVELNEEFWNELANDNEYIYDFGTDTQDNTLILFDSMGQMKKFNHLFVNTDEELTEDEVEELEAFTERYGLTREQVKEQYDECLDVATFYDSYGECCPECGRYMDSYEGTELNGEYICDECIENHGAELIEQAIEQSQGDFRKAISVSFDDDLIEQLGFTYIGENGCRRTFGEYQFENYDDVDLAYDIYKLFTGTVIKLTGVGQFQTYFYVAVPDEYSELAQAFADGELTKENISSYLDGDITIEQLWETSKEADDEDEDE